MRVAEVESKVIPDLVLCCRELDVAQKISIGEKLYIIDDYIPAYRHAELTPFRLSLAPLGR